MSFQEALLASPPAAGDRGDAAAPVPLQSDCLTALGGRAGGDGGQEPPPCCSPRQAGQHLFTWAAVNSSPPRDLGLEILIIHLPPPIFVFLFMF